MHVKEYIELSPELMTVLTSDQAWHYHIIPKEKSGNTLHFFSNEKRNAQDISAELELLLNSEVLLHPVAEELIVPSLGRYYRKTAHSGKDVHISINQADDFVQKLVQEAKELGSSDIHIEIYDERARIRIRIDGMLVERYKLDKLEYPALINKIKIRSNLDIAEKRLPQDGRIFFEHKGKKFDIRVSVLPTLHGEKVVMRLLSNDATHIQLDRLGFSDIEMAHYLEGMKKPNGIMLISGPTGSGKTTTLYATLKILNEERRNILTIEDPIEYTLEGINQVQLKESIGLSFASALRTFLRQDPDVIMLGEIRDGETAQMAIRAALTGHLVLSTIHTNSAWGTISRLLDMGVPAFLLANTLNTSVAQRLVRKLCPHCKREIQLTKEMLPPGFRLSAPLTKVYSPVGCEECHYTGYKGRQALYEVIPMDYELAEFIKTGKMDIDEALHQRGIKKLSQLSFDLLNQGITSIEEAYPLLINQ